MIHVVQYVYLSFGAVACLSRLGNISYDASYTFNFFDKIT